MKQKFLCFVILSSLVLSVSVVHGQSATAALRGVVTDPTGAVVSGAEVVITSNDTAQQHAQRSDSNGEFSFQELSIGDYRVEVRSRGFATSVNAHIHLDVGNQSQISVQLVAASTQQTIEVTAQASRLQTNEISQGFGASELVEFGWDIRAWKKSRSGITNPIGRYIINYSHHLARLKEVMPTEPIAASSK